MKKLMIAVAAVAMAVAANAATSHWKYYTGNTALKDGYNNKGTGTYTPATLNNFTTYLIDVTTIDQEHLLTQFRGATGVKAADLLGYSKGHGDTNASGKIPTASAILFDREDLDAEAGDTATYYIAMLAKDAQGKDYLYLSANSGELAAYSPDKTQLVNMGIGGTTVTYNGDKTFATGSSGWYAGAAAVPEPTSGLLLLLGVAGLALRRRRA